MGTPSCADCGQPIPDGASDCQSCGASVATMAAPSEAPQVDGYSIVRLLGFGGMGSVYLAQDDTLGRQVAIKAISERFGEEADARARFLREARSMASVEHPHVVRVYAYGEVERRAYLVMEYVEGESLAGRIRRLGQLPVDEALRIVRQVIDGLDAAWDKQLVHRDIKPANVLLDSRNQARVADFGLAKPLGVSDESSLTMKGLILGTPYYVSPEQAHGDVVDCRSDIYSLGIMFYEMLTGVRPFTGASPFSIVDQQVHKALPSLRQARPEIAQPVEDLVVWMTQKDPEQRPESYTRLRTVVDQLLGGEVGTRSATGLIPRFRRRLWPLVAASVLVVGAVGGATWSWRHRSVPAPPPAAVPATPKLKAVAVLPFQNNTGDPAQDYFGVGLADVITSRLAPSREVVVRPLSAVLSQKATDARAAGVALAVDYVAYGLVQRSGNQIRVSAHLYDVASDRDMWTDDIRSTETEVFALQDQIALPLAAALKVKVGGGDGLRATQMTTQRSEAYFNYLQGRERLMRIYSAGLVDKNLVEAADFLTKAIAIDPTFAAPKFTLARVMLNRFDMGFDLNHVEINRAIELANDAIRLDDRQAEAYAALGFAYLKAGRTEERFTTLKRALELEPNNEAVRHDLSVFYQNMGLWDEVLEQCDVIERLNPPSVYPIGQRAIVNLWQGQYQVAAERFRQYGFRTNGSAYGSGMLAVALMGAGQRVEAEQILSKADPLKPIWALAFAIAGDAERSRRFIDKSTLDFAEVDSAVAYMIAATYARLGDTDKAIAMVNQAIELGWAAYPAYRNDPNLNSIRNDSRFIAILRDLESRWQAAKISYRLPPA